MNTANQIYVYAIQFLSHLSSRYSRLLASPVAALASEVIDRTEKANSIYPSDNLRKELRKTHLLEARAALMALDVHLAHCYEIMMSNPAGCFSSGSGAAVPASNAKTEAGKHGANPWGDDRPRKQPFDKCVEKRQG